MNFIRRLNRENLYFQTSFQIFLSFIVAITCPELPKINLTSLSTNMAVFGTIVDVACDFGFWFTGSNNKVISLECLESGNWNGTTGTCERKWWQ